MSTPGTIEIGLWTIGMLERDVVPPRIAMLLVVVLDAVLGAVLGLVAAPLVFAFGTDVPLPRIDAGYGALALAGLLVGVGTRYASGCTSGHGVCGLSRLSPRSLVATAVFMGAGIVTVFVVRHVLGI